VFWNLDPRDYAHESSSEIARQVGEQISAGSVILLHDGVANREISSGEFVTVKALDAILKIAEHKGVPLLPLGHALKLN
jgi:uncharacterized protein